MYDIYYGILHVIANRRLEPNRDHTMLGLVQAVLEIRCLAGVVCSGDEWTRLAMVTENTTLVSPAHFPPPLGKSSISANWGPI